MATRRRLKQSILPEDIFHLVEERCNNISQKNRETFIELKNKQENLLRRLNDFSLELGVIYEEIKRILNQKEDIGKLKKAIESKEKPRPRKR